MIYQALANVMLDIKHVAKEKTNQQQGFNFRGIDDLYNAIHAALATHQVFTTSKIIDRQQSERTTAKGGTMFVTILRVAYTFHALDGSSVTTESEGESADSGDKSTSKALAMADKYALIQMFKVPTSDMPDADKESFKLASKPKISEEQISDIDSRIDSYGADRLKFMKWLGTMKINSIAEIPAEMFELVSAAVEKHNPKNKAAA
jgi:hypothetical protein